MATILRPDSPRRDPATEISVLAAGLDAYLEHRPRTGLLVLHRPSLGHDPIPGFQGARHGLEGHEITFLVEERLLGHR